MRPGSQRSAAERRGARRPRCWVRSRGLNWRRFFQKRGMAGHPGARNPLACPERSRTGAIFCFRPLSGVFGHARSTAYSDVKERAPRVSRRAMRPLYTYRARCAPGLPMAQHLLSKPPRRSRNAENLFRGEAFSLRGALRDLNAADRQRCPYKGAKLSCDSTLQPWRASPRRPCMVNKRLVSWRIRIGHLAKVGVPPPSISLSGWFYYGNAYSIYPLYNGLN